jgi:hypothetical protein
MTIKHYKNVIPQNEFSAIENILKNRNWIIQSSTGDGDTSFFYSEINQNEVNCFEKYFGPLVQEYIKENNITNQIFFERAYINCHPCYHPGSWHIDNESGLTLLYYPISKVNFKKEGGTAFKDFTQYYVENSLLIFPANMLHMATEHSHKGIFRYTVAFKFQLT